MNKIFSILVLLISLLFSSILFSQEKILKVGVAPGAPFVIIEQDQYKGIAVELWKKIAKNLDLKYEFVPVNEHIDDDIKLVSSNELDILIGPIVGTQERIELVDFTRPYYLSQIGIVVSAKQASFFKTLLLALNTSVGWFMLFLLVVLIIYVHIFWYFERKKNYMEVSPEYRKGIATAFWVNTLDVGFVSPPTHVVTRSTRFIWYFIGLPLLAATLAAILTSALTVSLTENEVQFNEISDFSNRVITAVPGTISYKLASQAELHIIPSDNRVDAMNLVLSGKSAGFVDYYSIADYYIRQNKLEERLSFVNFIMAQNTFAFAVPFNSTLRHKIDLELDRLQERGEINDICENFLDPKFVKNCQI